MSEEVGKIIIGQTFTGIINLKQDDGCDAENILPFVIPTSHKIEVAFPGASGSVILSSDNSGEITVLNAALGQFSYTGTPAKSALLKAGTKQSVNVKVTDLTPSPTVVYMFEQQKAVDIKAADNLFT